MLLPKGDQAFCKSYLHVPSFEFSAEGMGKKHCVGYTMLKLKLSDRVRGPSADQQLRKMTTDGMNPVETALGYHCCLRTLKTRPGS